VQCTPPATSLRTLLAAPWSRPVLCCRRRMAWHRQLSRPPVQRDTSSSALLPSSPISLSIPIPTSPSPLPSHTPDKTSSGCSSLPRDLSTQLSVEEEEEEEGFSLCPRAWCRAARAEGGARGAWRLAFMCLCLPACYPCYLTRKYRRRRRHQGPGSHGTPPKPALSPTTSTAVLSPSPLGPSLDQVLRVDALFLQSETSYQFLNRFPIRGGRTRAAAGEHTADVHLVFEPPQGRDPARPTPGLLADMDILVLPYRDSQEVEAILAKGRGLLDYCRSYWTGYFPLLLIRLGGDRIPLKKDTHAALAATFPCCLQIHLTEQFTKQEEAAMVTTLLRLYLHVFKLRCGGGEGRGPPPGGVWSCPGQCGLSTLQEHQKVVGKRRAARRALQAGAQRFLHRPASSALL